MDQQNEMKIADAENFPVIELMYRKSENTDNIPQKILLSTWIYMAKQKVRSNIYIHINVYHIIITYSINFIEFFRVQRLI